MATNIKDILNDDKILSEIFSNASSNRLKEISANLQILIRHKEDTERREEQKDTLQVISDAIDDYIQDYGSFSLKIMVPNGKGGFERYGFEIDDVGDARAIGFNGLVIDCEGMGGRE